MKKKSYKITIVGGLLFLFVGGLFLKNLKPSFAIQAGTFQPSLPTSTFSTNFGSSTLNYIETALTSNGQSSSYTHNFKTPDIDQGKTPYYLLMKNLEVPKQSSETFELIDHNPSSISDKGIQYILNHGYNLKNTTNTVFSSSESASSLYKQRYYVTQIALWLYIYEKQSSFNSTYCANNGCLFTTSTTSTSPVNSSEVRSIINQAGGYNNYAYLKKIITLVDNAKNYTGATAETGFDIGENTQFHYKIDADFSKLTTDEITPTYNANNFMYYAIEMNDQNHYGAYIADKDGNKITDTSKMSGSFKIVVPLREDITTMNLGSIQILLYGYFFKDAAYSYRVTNSTSGTLINTNKTQKYSDILFGDIPYEIDGVVIKLYNFEKISKIDATNSQELPGATLEVINVDNPEDKITWVSGTTPHYIHLNNGKYKLCETIAPKGYALNTECIEFTVDDSKIMAVTMKNEPEVPTEDTGFFKTNRNILFGIGLIFLGFIGFLIGSKMKRTSEN